MRTYVDIGRYCHRRFYAMFEMGSFEDVLRRLDELSDDLRREALALMERMGHPLYDEIRECYHEV